MKRVLIFGIDSFTGIHLSKYLKGDGYSIFGTTKRSCDITRKGDIIEILRKVNPNYILNFSAISSPIHHNSLEFYRVNTIGAINILEVLRELNLTPTKTILPSSAIVYGNQEVEILDESLTPHPTSHYGTSKYSMESLAQHHFNSLNIIVTRPFNYTGVGQSDNFIISKIVKHFRERRPYIELGNLNVIREFNDIEFICEVYKRLLESSVQGEIVNICSGRGVQLMEIVESMNQIADYNIEVRVNPKFIRKDDTRTLTGSPQKLFSLIGEVKQKPFSATLQSMFKSF
jgi:nucleoside-diphosphate-sugar epimerase